MNPENTNSNIDQEIELIKLEIEKLELEKELKLQPSPKIITDDKSYIIEEPQVKSDYKSDVINKPQVEYDYDEPKNNKSKIYIWTGIVLVFLGFCIFLKFKSDKVASSVTTSIDSVGLDSITVDTSSSEEQISTPTLTETSGTLPNDFNYDVYQLLNLDNLSEMKSKVESIFYRVEDAYDMEGNVTGKQLVLFPNTKNEIFIISKDMDSKIKSVVLRKDNSDWVTPFDITVGTTLDELNQMNNKEIKFYGLETDNGGLVDWNEGKLEYNGLSVTLSTNINLKIPDNVKKYYEVASEGWYLSNTENIKDLKLFVSEVRFTNKE